MQPKPHDLLRLAAALLFIASLYVLYFVYHYTAPLPDGIQNDFLVFRIAGDLVRKGEFDILYSFKALKAYQETVTQTPGFYAPWAYPPQGDFLAMAIASLPPATSYLVYVGVPYGIFLALGSHLAGRYWTLVFIMAFPAALMTIYTGQNGFFSAAFAGLFALAQLRKSRLAGVPVGLLVFKPQLGLAVAVYLLATRQWRTLLVAIATVILSSGLLTLLFGANVWGLFLEAADQATHNLSGGHYPSHRMVSVYETVRSFGLGHWAASTFQLMSTLLLLGLVVLCVRKGADPRLSLGLSIAVMPLCSPYAFDYDLPVLFIGLAIMASIALEQSSRPQIVTVIILLWIAGGSGLFLNYFIGHAPPAVQAQLNQTTPTVAGPAAILALIILVRNGLRAGREGRGVVSMRPSGAG